MKLGKTPHTVAVFLFVLLLALVVVSTMAGLARMRAATPVADPSAGPSVTTEPDSR
jgi:hypothetical protein